VTDADEPPYGHEPSGVAERRVVRIAAILIVLLVGAGFALHFTLRSIAPQHALIVARPGTVPPPPRLEVRPATDRAAFDVQKHALLSGWHWLDADRAFARIPIDRAMAIYAQQHANEATPASPAGATP